MGLRNWSIGNVTPARKNRRESPLRLCNLIANNIRCPTLTVEHSTTADERISDLFGNARAKEGKSMLKNRDAKILDGDADGDILHVEWTTDDGETVVGVYENLGWTTPPMKQKLLTEVKVWVKSSMH